MKILLLGSGGREHALAWKIASSSHTSRLFVAPGNSGIAEQADCVSIEATDIPALLKFAKSNQIDWVVVGPEQPLVEGVADVFLNEGFLVFGPKAQGARLEASKTYTKNLLKKKKIPTAGFEYFSDFNRAKEYLANKKFPLVVKADGLAGGKGVMICQHSEEAIQAVEEILVKKSLGQHQSQVVIEDFLWGEEASFMGIFDGQTFLPFASSQDHKRVYDHDEGPNTGGMGAYSPAPIVNPTVDEKVRREIIQPTLEGLKEEGVDYRGVLYAGLMIQEDQPYLLEYNVRLGDPECQAILPRLRSDFVELALAVAEGHLAGHSLLWEERSCVCVVLTAKGYPGSYEKGDVIEGLEAASRVQDVTLFHAGTLKKNGQWLTHGGRVLGVSALGDTLEKAIARAYEAVEKIHWKGMHYRKDIGQKGLKLAEGYRDPCIC
jgi:phosphoribosylamine--glycine ligase